MTDRRGVKIAIQYLNSFFPVVLFKDELHKRAGCTCSYDDLGRKLRAAAAIGKVVAVPYENEHGTKITRYQGNPGWVKPYSIKLPPFVPLENRLTDPAPAVYFYALNEQNKTFSPYFTNREDMFADALQKGVDPVYFTGTHDNPVRL